MARETKRQKETVDRVMHEFKHGELESGPDGKAGKVKTPRQAIAIALSEAGVSNRKPPAQNRKTRAATVAKQAKGETAKDVKEGRSAPQASRADLYAEARKRGVPGRSRMDRAALERALKA